MGGPTPETGYTSSRPRREEKETQKEKGGDWGKKKKKKTHTSVVLKGTNYFTSAFPTLLDS